MATRLLGLPLAVAIVTAGCLAGPIGPADLPSSLAPVIERNQNFTGWEGSYKETGKIGWVDAAIAPAAGAKITAVFVVKWAPRNGTDGPPAWACRAYLAIVGCTSEWGDGSIEVGGGLGDQRIHVGQPDPSTLVFNRSRESHKGVKITMDSGKPPGSSVHVTFAVGGPPIKNVSVRLDWTDTAVNVTTGPPSDTYEYLMEDMNTTAYARADSSRLAAGQYYAKSHSHLGVDLPRDAPWTRFWFLPQNSFDRADAWYVPPNGSWTPVDFLASKATAEEGRWWFHVGRNAGNEYEVPVVMGMNYEPALLPWEDPEEAP